MTLEAIGPLAFISIFHVIGGVALGLTLRAWTDNPTTLNLRGRIFFLVWGSMFGCLPLTMGFQEGSQTLAVQIVVLAAAIVIPFIWRDRLAEMASEQYNVAIAIGGIFLIAGLVAGGYMLREREWLFAALFGGLFVLVGGSVFFGGLRNLIRDPSSDE